MPDRLTIEFPSMEELKQLRTDMEAMEKRLTSQMDALRAMFLELMASVNELRKEARN